MVVVWGVCLVPDSPTTTPKLQLDFLDLENFLVKVWSGGGGGCLAPDPPNTTTPKLQLNFLDLESFLVKVWSGGGGEGVWHQTTPKPKLIMSSHEMWRHMLVILSNVECARNGWSDVQNPPPPPLNSNLTFWT